PTMQIEHPGLIYFIYFALIIANFLMYGMAIVLVKPCVRLFSLPQALLMPMILPICMLGAYAVSLSYFDIYIMLAAGVVGYLLRRFGFPLAPMVLAVILGPVADENFRRTLVVLKGESWWTVMVEHPIGVLLLIVVLYTFYDGIFRQRS
ncbi:MAG: tripartite tricarboxylate transporter permease, partial [Burkholderiales bacterium]